jgi:hypothetical protein
VLLLRRSLASVREPRLYLSMERSYLSLVKFLFIAFATGILAKKFTFLLLVLRLPSLLHFFDGSSTFHVGSRRSSLPRMR